jgi:hypothetical protein
MSYQTVRVRQLVDWGAAVRAGFIALVYGTSSWQLLRQFASIVLGEPILPPPATADGMALLVGVLLHFVLSLIYALIIAYVIHRGGLIGGIVGGALLGLGFYAINLYTFTLFRPWLFSLNNWVFLLNHLIFGALAGGIYEALEEEIYVPVEDETESGSEQTEVQS